MVVLATGPAGSAGDSVVINEVKQSGEKLYVHVTAYVQCSPLAIATVPVDLIRVAQSDRTPVFETDLVRGPECKFVAP
jgi:hypothetical protein